MQVILSGCPLNLGLVILKFMTLILGAFKYNKNGLTYLDEVVLFLYRRYAFPTFV